jgi:hypothetical protein
MSEQGDKAARARARCDWPVRGFKLGEEPPDDLSQTTTPLERFAMMWPLAVQAWALAGRAHPTYGRSTIPIRVFRNGELPPDDDASG